MNNIVVSINLDTRSEQARNLMGYIPRHAKNDQKMETAKEFCDKTCGKILLLNQNIHILQVFCEGDYSWERNDSSFSILKAKKIFLLFYLLLN